MNNDDIFGGYGIHVTLRKRDDFLKVRETLTRIGIESSKDKTLYQSCHILHKRGKYAIMHFKELFMIDGKESNISDNDLDRRNTIVRLLEDWGLVDVVSHTLFRNLATFANMSQIKIIPHHAKDEWVLQAKYDIGKKKGSYVAA